MPGRHDAALTDRRPVTLMSIRAWGCHKRHPSITTQAPPTRCSAICISKVDCSTFAAMPGSDLILLTISTLGRFRQLRPGKVLLDTPTGTSPQPLRQGWLTQ